MGLPTRVPAMEGQAEPGLHGLANQMSPWTKRSTGGPRNIHDVYSVDTNTVLGVGSFGRVLIGRNKVTGETCAIKQIAKYDRRHACEDPDESLRRTTNARAGALRQEVNVMEKLDHPNIIRLCGLYEDDLNNYLVMQLCEGGRVIDFIAHMQEYRESDAAIVMQQVFAAVEYMHKKQIVHRDVKPDNMLLQSWRPLKDNTLKLIDFGLSCVCSPGRDLRHMSGTPAYMSPQAIDGRFDIQTDLWSCGATLYELLCGHVPFRAGTEARVIEAVRRGNFTFAAADWRCVSDNAKNLIRALLKMNPCERPTAEQALEDEWVRHFAPGTHANEPLQRAVNAFCHRSTHRELPSAKASGLTDVRVALSEVSSWVNSFLPQSKVWEAPSKVAWF